jgi:hypothetical protein
MLPIAGLIVQSLCTQHAPAVNGVKALSREDVLLLCRAPNERGI